MKKITASAVFVFAVLMMLMTGCGVSAEDSSSDSLTDDSGILQPEVMSEESENEESLISSTSTSQADSGVTSVAHESDSSAVQDSSQAISGDSSAATSLTAKEASVIYVILPSGSGSSATEASVIRSYMEDAGYSVILRPHGGSADTQSAAFNEAIAARASAIICENVESADIVSSIQSAKDVGIPTFLMDKGIEMTGVAEAQVLTDRFSSVPMLAQIFAKNRNHKTNYLELAGASSDSRSEDAMEAFDDAMSAFPDMVLAASVTQDTYDYADAKAKVATMLSDNPNADALICYSEMQTKAGLEAIAAAGRTNMEVLCVCGDGDSIETLISAGTVTASVVKPANELADTVSKDVLSFLKSGSFKSNERQYINADILTASGITR